MKKAIKRSINRLAPGVKVTMDRIGNMEEQLRHIEAQVEQANQKLVELQQHDNRLDQLRALAAAVEPYQPAYGIAGVIDAPNRSESRDRCTVIERALSPLPGKRILDIGSSLGFFSFYFADRSATVEGWEVSPQNAEVARRIGEINGIHVDFKVKELNDETVQTVPYGAFDAVFILSVFHHIIRFHGLEYTQQLVKDLFDRIPVMVVELARKGEDSKLPWDASQPEDERAIFDLVKDDVTIEKLGNFGTHLSKKVRPLYVVRKKQQVKVNNRLYAYGHSASEAYKDSPVVGMGVKRRYYFGNDFIVKEYSFDAKSAHENVGQILNEVKVFSEFDLHKAKIFHAPKLLDFEIDMPHGAKIALERVEGSLVIDMDLRGKTGKVQKVVEDVLKTLRDLEAMHLHHNDVRSWNIIVNESGSAWLIDYGLVGGRQIGTADVVGLLWAAHAMLNGERETYLRQDELPAQDSFKESPALLAMYKQVKKGERSATKLLAAFK